MCAGLLGKALFLLKLSLKNTRLVILPANNSIKLTLVLVQRFWFVQEKITMRMTGLLLKEVNSNKEK